MNRDEARKKMLKLRKYPMLAEDAVFLDNFWFEVQYGIDELTTEDLETLNDICNRYGNDQPKSSSEGRKSVSGNVV
jgi:hypothetical protein